MYSNEILTTEMCKVGDEKRKEGGGQWNIDAWRIKHEKKNNNNIFKYLRGLWANDINIKRDEGDSRKGMWWMI